MELSSELVTQFVKATNDNKPASTESTVYGTTVEYNGKIYVRLDGSDRLTPVSTTTDMQADERVTVMIKNHTATVTGNLSSPAARTDTVKDLGNKLNEFDIIVADKVTTKQLEAEIARIDQLVADNVTINEKLTANEASIKNLQAENVDISGKLTAVEAEIDDLSVNKLDASVADIKYATIESLKAVNAFIYNLDVTYATIAELEANYAKIADLEAVHAAIEDLEVGKLDANWANIDSANISDAVITELFAKFGIIDNLVVSDGHITGSLTAVTIKGDLIEAGTLVADSLVLLGEDGLYYKLNTDGVSIEAEQTEYNSLNGSVITAKTITAEKIHVDDLIAFGATIGGFNIGIDSLYSGVKDSVDNSTRGIYLDTDGQIAFGDSNNYIRFYVAYSCYSVFYDETTGVYTRNESPLPGQLDGDIVDGALTEDGHQVYAITYEGGTTKHFCRIADDYKLAISADSILFGSENKSSISDLVHLSDHVKIGTYKEENTGEVLPCVELAESDSSFKARLTNKNVTFVDGVNDSTTIDSDGVTTENIAVKHDIRQYDFIWRRRSNGNLGLMWMEVTE